MKCCSFEGYCVPNGSTGKYILDGSIGCTTQFYADDIIIDFSIPARSKVMAFFVKKCQIRIYYLGLQLIESKY